MNITEYFFLLSLLGTGYSYFIYPLILLPFQGRNKYQLNIDLDKNKLPLISFIITAFNEEKNIEQKIINTLEAEYDPDHLEILVASDGSTDQTNELVEKYKFHGVSLVEVTDRKGKENAQLHAIRQAKGDLLVFSDVSTRIEKNALYRIAQVFSNSNIGAISSEDRFITTEGQIAGEGAYVKYEMWLRKLESSSNSLVGLSGSFFGCRKSICRDWSILVPSDFNTAINTIQQGNIAISDPELLGYYPNIKDEKKEFQRKVRTVLRGMAALFHKQAFLNPFKYGFFSFQLISHKLMRWLVPIFMAVTFIINILLLHESFIYEILFIGQVLFYLTALIGQLSVSCRNNKLVKIIYFFVQVNLAIAVAMIMFLTGKRITLWEPSKR